MCQYWTQKTVLTDISNMGASLGNCIPPLTFILFAAMLTKIDEGRLQYGLRHHPDKPKVAFFMMRQPNGA